MVSPESLHAHRRILAARGALWLSASSWIAKASQTIVLLVLARALTPAEFSVLAVAALTYSVLLVITHLGIVDALTYLTDRIEEASETALSIVVAGGLVLTGVTWALAPLIAHFFHSPDGTFVLRGFSLGIPLDAAAQVPIGRLTRSLNFSRRTVTDSLPSVIGAAVTIVVVATGHPLIGLVAGQLAGSLTNVTVAMLIGPRCWPGWSTVMARRLLRYGKYLSAADLLNLGLLNVDYVIIGHVLGPYALGLYSLAYRLCFMPYLSISVVANGALFPYYCRLPSREAKARTAENAFSLINALSIPWFAGLVLFAGDIALLGNKWAPATGAVRFLAVYGFFLSLILSALEVLKAVGRMDLVFWGRGLHLTILTVVLIATVRSGITIVALDQAVVAAAIAAAFGLLTIRYASVRPGALGRSVALPLLGALGMAAVILLLSLLPGLPPPPSWTSLLILGPLSLVAFGVIVRVVMPGPLVDGWAALRGRSGVTAPATADHPGPADKPAGGLETSLLAVRELGRWAPQWDRLVDRSPVPSPFLRSWWLTGVSGPRPRFLLVVHGDHLLGGLALEERRWLGLPHFRVMGAGLLCPDHLDLVTYPGYENAVTQAVRAWLSRPGARLLDVAGIHAGSRLITTLPGDVRCEPLAGAPWTPLPADADAYLAARPRNFRRNLRKAQARMETEGVAHRVSRGSSVTRSLETLRLLHTAQWGAHSRFLPIFDRFAAACRLGAEHDEVAVHDLHAGETVIAIMVSFEVAGRVSLYQSARRTEPHWRDATAVLLAAIIADACHRGFAEIDFLRGDEPYKSNFAQERRELLRLQAASGWAGEITLRMETAGRRAKRMAAARLRPADHRDPGADLGIMNARDELAPKPHDIAVIIPAFNSGAHIDQALASVASQAIPPSAVVVADDCSTDDTAERARRWQGRLPLQVIQLSRNQGPGVARHRAIEACSASLLAMLDADDLFLPDHLECMAAAHAASPGLISAQELSWSPGVSLTQLKGLRTPRKSTELHALLRQNYINFALFSRDLYELAGGFGDLYVGEDWDLWIRMVRAGAKVTMTSHPTAVHRVHSRSLTFNTARTAQQSVAVLSAALRTAQSPAEADAARLGLQILRGKLSFYRATELAARGDLRRARQVAFDALPGGSLRATAGLLALALAPSSAARLERLTRPYRLPAGAHTPTAEIIPSGRGQGADRDPGHQG